LKDKYSQIKKGQIRKKTEEFTQKIKCVKRRKVVTCECVIALEINQ
jgi:biotin synthase-related radical SAM superfamily protein